MIRALKIQIASGFNTYLSIIYIRKKYSSSHYEQTGP